MKILKHLIAITLFGVSITAMAYDAVGHRIVADIAYTNLTEKARTQLDSLLGKRGIVYKSTWADEVRSDSTYKYSYQWHYQNLADSLTVFDFKELLDKPKMEGSHLFFAIDTLTTRLKKNKGDLEALKFLVHFVGDLHQPMHLGRLVDLGGNKVSTKWFGRTINLHSLWDSSLIEQRNFSYSEFSQYLQDTFDRRKMEFLKYSVLESVTAGYDVRTKIYEYDNTDTNNYHYMYYFNDKMDEMLYRGGIQLANMLNAIYK